jgi:prophage regulatory protein
MENLADQILRIKDVQHETKLARATIYNFLSEQSKYFDPTFPKPFKLGTRAVGFKKSEILEWINLQAEARSSK